jgi:myosin heavy subunit
MVFFNKVLFFRCMAWLTALQGERVWAPHATSGWVVASVLSQDATGVLVQTDGGEELRVADSKLLPFSPESVAYYNDMIQISDLVEPVLLHNLRKRYEADKIYV